MADGDTIGDCGDRYGGGGDHVCAYQNDGGAGDSNVSIYVDINEFCGDDCSGKCDYVDGHGVHDVDKCDSGYVWCQL